MEFVKNIGGINLVVNLGLLDIIYGLGIWIWISIICEFVVDVSEILVWGFFLNLLYLVIEFLYCLKKDNK